MHFNRNDEINFFLNEWNNYYLLNSFIDIDKITFHFWKWSCKIKSNIKIFNSIYILFYTIIIDVKTIISC